MEGRRQDDRGITSKYHIERAIERQVIVEEEETAKVSASAGLSTHFAGELKSAIESTTSLRRSARYTERINQLKERKLYLDPADRANDGVRARAYEAAQVYVRKRAVIRISCECCNNRQIVSIAVKAWTGELETRQVDYREEGAEGAKPVVYPTGTIDLR